MLEKSIKLHWKCKFRVISMKKSCYADISHQCHVQLKHKKTKELLITYIHTLATQIDPK